MKIEGTRAISSTAYLASEAGRVNNFFRAFDELPFCKTQRAVIESHEPQIFALNVFVKHMHRRIRLTDDPALWPTQLHLADRIQVIQTLECLGSMSGDEVC